MGQSLCATNQIEKHSENADNIRRTHSLCVRDHSHYLNNETLSSTKNQKLISDEELSGLRRNKSLYVAKRLVFEKVQSKADNCSIEPRKEAEIIPKGE